MRPPPVRHRSPQRELGDCGVAHQLDKSLAQAGSSLQGSDHGMAGGVAFVPAVPGLAPGAFMGQGSGNPDPLEGVIRKASRTA